MIIHKQESRVKPQVVSKKIQYYSNLNLIFVSWCSLILISLERNRREKRGKSVILPHSPSAKKDGKGFPFD